jgi:hypothetical protein
VPLKNCGWLVFPKTYLPYLTPTWYDGRDRDAWFKSLRVGTFLPPPLPTIPEMVVSFANGMYPLRSISLYRPSPHDPLPARILTASLSTIRSLNNHHVLNSVNRRIDSPKPRRGST